MIKVLHTKCPFPRLDVAKHMPSVSDTLPKLFQGLHRKFRALLTSGPHVRDSCKRFIGNVVLQAKRSNLRLSGNRPGVARLDPLRSFDASL